MTERPVSVLEAKRRSRIDQFTKALALRDKIVKKRVQADRKALAESDIVFKFKTPQLTSSSKDDN